MRELHKSWRDLLTIFRIALDLRKMVLGFTLVVLVVLHAALLVALLSWGTIEAANEEHRAGLDREVESAGPAGQMAPAETGVPQTQEAGGSAGGDDATDPAPEAPVNSYAGWVAADGRSFWRLIGDAIGGDTAAPRILGDSVTLALADLGIGTAIHPTTGARRAAGGPSPGVIILLVVLLVSLWFFAAHPVGTLLRLITVEIGYDERIEWRVAGDFASRKKLSIFFGLLSPAVFVGAVWLAAVAWAAISTIPVAGGILAGILLPFLLFAGFLAALVALGLVCAWCQIPAAIAAEGTDSFDAISRGFSYLFGRPWAFFGYWLFAIVYSVPAIGFVVGFTALVLGLLALPVGWILGEQFDRLTAFLALWEPGGCLADINIADGIGGAILAVIALVVLLILAAALIGYVIAYFAAAAQMIYFLQRYHIDGGEPHEIFIDQEEDLFSARAVELRLDAARRMLGRRDDDSAAAVSGSADDSAGEQPNKD
jgi:hypothetical protein